MKIVFDNTYGDTKVAIEQNGVKQDFSYVELIKALCNRDEIQDVVFIGDIPGEEQKIIKEFADEISQKTSECIKSLPDYTTGANIETSDTKRDRFMEV